MTLTVTGSLTSILTVYKLRPIWLIKKNLKLGLYLVKTMNV